MSDQSPADPPDYTRFSRADLVLLRRAARSNWGVPDCVKNETLFSIAKAMADDRVKLRWKLAAGRLLVLMDRADQLAAANPETDLTASDVAAEFLKSVAEADADSSPDARPDRGGAAPVLEEPGPVQPDDPGAGPVLE